MIEQIEWVPVAERIAAMARSYEDRARVAHTTMEDRTSDRHAECAADLRTVVSLLNGMADMEPVARIYTDAELVHRDPRWGRVCWIVPEWELDGGALLYLHPAPQPQPVLSGYGDYGAAIPGIERPCTCHPDDNPPVPCTQKYALNECRAASEPTEAQIEQLRSALVIAEAALADIGDAEREPGDDLKWCEQRAAEALPDVRAALAAKESAL